MTPYRSTAPFRTRLLEREQLLGSFLKIPSIQPAEVLGLIGFDFVVIDEEHAAINRETTDSILLACHAYGLDGLVRVRRADEILAVLDAGADGVLVPHVTSAEIAREIVALCRYRRGNRGYSATTRAGNFGGVSMREHIDGQDSRVTAIAMIEDSAAVEHIDEIVAVEGLDAIFIGRGDLAVSLGENGGPEAVFTATRRVVDAALHTGVAIMVLANDPKDAAELASLGVTAFVASSDQGLLRTAAAGALLDFSAVLNRAKRDIDSHDL